MTSLVDRVVRSPGTSGFMLQGPAGIGKSTLLSQIAHRLTERGYTPLHVRGSIAAAPVSFGPFAPLFSAFEITETEGFAALSALSSALMERSSDTVLLVDDVARMDSASILAIQQVVHGVGLTVILTVREDEVPAGISEMCDQGIISTEQVTPLSAADVRQIASDHLGGPLSPRAALALVEHVDGNPLHLRELLMASREQDALEWTGSFFDLTGDLALGQRITDLVGRRFDSLPPAHLEALELLAAGQPLAPQCLDPAIVDELERSGLIERCPMEGLHLGHPLYDDVLRARTAPSWWRTTQARAAALLRDGVSGSATDEPSARDALHRAIVLDVSAGTPTPAGELTAAAVWAAGRSDPALAAQLASRALESESIHQAHQVLGVAAGTLGDLDLAETHLRAAIESASSDEDLARLAGPVGLFWGTRRYNPPEALRMLGVLADRSTGAPAPSIRSEIAFWRMMTGQSPGELFAEDGDEIDQLSVAVNQSLIGVVSGPLSLVEPAVTRGFPLAIAYQEQLPHAVAFLQFSHVAGAALSGDLNRARELAHDYLGSSGQTDGETLGMWQQLLGTLELTQGNAATAHAYAIDAQRNLSWRDIGGMLPAANALLVATSTHQGRSRDIARARSALSATPPEELRVTMMLGWAQVRALRDKGCIDAAVLHATTVGHELVEQNAIYLGAILLHLAVRMGQPDLVVDTLEQITRTSGGGLLDLLHRHAVAVLDRDHDAMLALVTDMSTLGSISMAADVATQLSLWLRADGLPPPTPTWRANLRELRASAGPTGPWTERLTQEVDTPLLTERELDVARMAATRLRSREIADTLNISVRTVDNHLQSVYRKLDVNSRTGLADALTKSGEGVPFSHADEA